MTTSPDLRTSLEAEQSLLGALLLAPEVLSRVEGTVRPEDMALETDRDLYRAILALAREGKGIDPVTVKARTEQDGGAAAGEYLFQLMEIAPTAATVEAHAKLVKLASLRRSLRALGEEAVAQMDGHEDPLAAAAELARKLDALQADGPAGDLRSSADTMVALYEHQQRVMAGESSGFVPTGFRDIDAVLGGGMLCGGLYILAARPGMGKTTLAINIADRVAEKTGPVLFVSLEMDQEQIAAKRVARLSGIPGSRLLMDKLTEAEWARQAAAVHKLNALPVWVHQPPTATVDDIAAAAHRVKGVRLVVVDYIGKIVPDRDARRKDRVEYMTEISGALKTLARSLRVPVLVLAQLNRQVEGRQDKRPQLSDLRDTGAIEQDADGVLMLHRPDYYSGRRPEGMAPSQLDVIVAKNRHGGTGTAEMAICLPLSKVHAVSNDPRRAWQQSLKASGEA